MATDVVIGRNVHHKMWEQHIAHRAVYEALGITRFTLAKKLRGDIAWSAADVAVAARVLGVEPGRLFEGGAADLREDSSQVTHEKVTHSNVVRFVSKPRPLINYGTLAPVIRLDDYRKQAAA